MTDKDASSINRAEFRLPKTLLDKAVMSGYEFGWKEEDVLEVIRAANELLMGMIGGQVQYLFPDGTCELYWLEYDPSERKRNEDWKSYCNRTAEECSTKFKELIASKNIDEEAADSFNVLKNKVAEGIDISQNKTFILYFDDSETENETAKS
jgi:hypothetical protein